jgi:hypothetical protein
VGGAEIDLLIDFGSSPKELWAIEIKRSASVGLGRGFHEASTDIEPTRKFIIHGGTDTFPMKNDIQAINLLEFLQILAGK